MLRHSVGPEGRITDTGMEHLENGYSNYPGNGVHFKLMN